MKKLMMVALCALAANVARAETIYNVEIDELKYTLDTDTKTAELEGYTGSPTKVDVGEVEYQGQKYIVTEVSLRAVPDCGSLTSVSLPNATTIGGFAFSGCGSLTSVSLPNATTIGDNAFYGCGSLTSVLLPNAATIGGGAFDGCGSLTSLALPNAMMIGGYALSCAALSTLVVNPVMKATIETNRRSEYGLSDSVEIIPAEGDFKYVLEGSVVVPKDRVIPEGHVAVSKESIAAAKAETVQIVNGQVELGVSVLSNADITASTANWSPVKFTKDTQIGLSADGTKLVLPIPVAAQQGFMILQSGDAKAAHSDTAGTVGFMIPGSVSEE